jgi:hypothetical protein
MIVSIYKDKDKKGYILKWFDPNTYEIDITKMERYSILHNEYHTVIVTSMKSESLNYIYYGNKYIGHNYLYLENNKKPYIDGFDDDNDFIIMVNIL